MKYTVYILLCSDETYHVGLTKYLEDRLLYHESGKNPFTKNVLPVQLVYQYDFSDLRDANIFKNDLEQLKSSAISDFISGNLQLETRTSFANSEDSKSSDSISKIIPAVYLGNIAYFESLSEIDHIYLDGNESYEKQTYRSRCVILSANGIQNLVVPVIRPNGKATLVKDVQISYAENWQKDHIKAIESAYRKAPFYNHYAEDLFVIIRKKHKNLISLNFELTQFILRKLGNKAQIELANESQSCSLASKKLVHPKTCPNPQLKAYHQTFGTANFESNISIIDWLFNVGIS